MKRVGKLNKEQQNIAGCKRKFSSSGGEGSSTASVQPKKSTQIGQIKLFFKKESNEVTQQTRKNEAKVIDEAKKKLKDNAIQKFDRWMYDVGILFNIVNYDSRGQAIEAIGQDGSAHCIDLMSSSFQI
ncbi:hypothetical protein Salat_0610000 [Sesamum alatum]|uniref:Uncharacterized protein n=1 Tax=Sesamum alatum TaxID=300844 RepID=A0AAE1YQS2_9LAMI|nr:hypothetical protein Salat_0610000 [Sesamum alatum]